MNKNKKINKLILASSSENRENILRKMKIPFEVFTPEIDEKSLFNEKPQQLVKRLSYEKAIVAKRKYKKHNIIAADTIVFARKRIVDKTTDINLAKLNLKILSGRRHRVFTGLTFIKNDNRFYQYVCKSIIKFRVLSEKDIVNFIKEENYTLQPNVNKTTNLLIAEDKDGSSTKIKKAQDLKIEIYEPGEFRSKFMKK